MTNDYTKGKAGFYMMLESFSKHRKCERMIAKIKFPVPIHLLDHESSYNSNTRLRRLRVPLVSSVHGRKIPTHKLSGLELRPQLCRLRQEMFLGKFYRMAWTVHAHADAPAPSWVVHPARMTSLHTRLNALTAACQCKQTKGTVSKLDETKDTLSSFARAPSPRHSTLVPHHESSTKTLSLRHGPPKFCHQTIRDCGMDTRDSGVGGGGSGIAQYSRH